MVRMVRGSLTLRSDLRDCLRAVAGASTSRSCCTAQHFPVLHCSKSLFQHSFLLLENAQEREREREREAQFWCDTRQNTHAVHGLSALRYTKTCPSANLDAKAHTVESTEQCCGQEDSIVLSECEPYPSQPCCTQLSKQSHAGETLATQSCQETYSLQEAEKFLKTQGCRTETAFSQYICNLHWGAQCASRGRCTAAWPAPDHA